MLLPSPDRTSPLHHLRRPVAALAALAALGLGVATGGCAEAIPEKVVLKPEGEKVEVVSEKPNPDLYVALGEVVGTASGVDKDAAYEQAKNDLRNQVSARGGTVVGIDNVDSKLQMGTRKTVVKLSGTAYKAKD